MCDSVVGEMSHPSRKKIESSTPKFENLLNYEGKLCTVSEKRFVTAKLENVSIILPLESRSSVGKYFIKYIWVNDIRKPHEKINDGLQVYFDAIYIKNGYHIICMWTNRKPSQFYLPCENNNKVIVRYHDNLNCRFENLDFTRVIVILEGNEFVLELPNSSLSENFGKNICTYSNLQATVVESFSSSSAVSSPSASCLSIQALYQIKRISGTDWKEMIYHNNTLINTELSTRTAHIVYLDVEIHFSNGSLYYISVTENIKVFVTNSLNFPHSKSYKAHVMKMTEVWGFAFLLEVHSCGGKTADERQANNIDNDIDSLPCSCVDFDLDKVMGYSEKFCTKIKTVFSESPCINSEYESNKTEIQSKENVYETEDILSVDSRNLESTGISNENKTIFSIDDVTFIFKNSITDIIDKAQDIKLPDVKKNSISIKHFDGNLRYTFKDHGYIQQGSSYILVPFDKILLQKSGKVLDNMALTTACIYWKDPSVYVAIYATESGCKVPPACLKIKKMVQATPLEPVLECIKEVVSNLTLIEKAEETGDMYRPQGPNESKHVLVSVEVSSGVVRLPHCNTTIAFMAHQFYFFGISIKGLNLQHILIPGMEVDCMMSFSPEGMPTLIQVSIGGNSSGCLTAEERVAVVKEWCAEYGVAEPTVQQIISKILTDAEREILPPTRKSIASRTKIIDIY